VTDVLEPPALSRAERKSLEKRVDALMHRASGLHVRGRIDDAARAYREAIALVPWYGAAYYDLGLVYKYSRRWRSSLKANLEALKRQPDDEAAAWNAGIAATALGDWRTARAMWKARGIRLPGRSGDPAGNFGVAVVRLNPEGSGGETVWARRVDPVRAVIANVPLPDSGYRCGDIVLHDGAAQGFREADGHRYPVFNVLERLLASKWKTYAADLVAPSREDIDALQELARGRAIRVEDWTRSVAMICLRCSYGVRHRHRRRAESPSWNPERSIGISAPSRREAQHLLDEWRNAGGREVRAVYARVPKAKPTRARRSWWSYEEFEKDG
jgi:tetratricopeptide (TPR) repeat protein